MTKHDPNDFPAVPPVALSQWELQRRHRLLLDQRVRLVRRVMVAGGLIGTVAFSMLAGYQTRGASQANEQPRPPEAKTALQSTSSDFFVQQASSGLSAATGFGDDDSPVTAAETATAATATATATATAAPSYTSSSDDEENWTPPDETLPQRHTRTHSSN